MVCLIKSDKARQSFLQTSQVMGGAVCLKITLHIFDLISITYILQFNANILN